MAFALSDLCIVVACNDEACLARNLMASPLVAAGVPVHVERGAPSASVAYNRGLAATTAPLVIFAHQDVWFPPGWEERLARAIAALEAEGKPWALLGPFGMSVEGQHLGDVWSTSLGRRVGAAVPTPQPVQSFDELAFVMRRASGLGFDEALPLWHFYGTDIVQTALALGQGAYVFDAPLVHNDGFKAKLGDDFTQGYNFIRRKWRAKLPIRSSILWITRFGTPLWRYRLRAGRALEKRRAMALDTGVAPEIYAAQSGIAELD
jgi:glycosyltransferase involved in cell wall biosynthesis